MNDVTRRSGGGGKEWVGLVWLVCVVSEGGKACEWMGTHVGRGEWMSVVRT